MEAPSVKSVETTKLKDNLKFDVTESFELEDNYILKISFNKEIMFYEIEENNTFPKLNYNIFLNLEELNKINRFFINLKL